MRGVLGVVGIERLVGDHDDPVAPGTRLLREDDGEWRDLGVVTTWAYSFARDGGVVLAYLKRRHQEAGTRFRVGDGPATAEVLEVSETTVEDQWRFARAWLNRELAG